MNLKTGTSSVLAALLTLTGTALAADYSSWAKVRSVTLNTSAMTLSGPVYNIPLAVRFNSTDHADLFTGGSAMLANGADVRVTKADGTTDVPFEIETASATSLVLWIKADTVPVSGSKSFRVFWNKAGQTTVSNSKAVFDTANGFVAVWHMNSLNDATYNNHMLVASSSAPAVAHDTNSFIGESRTFVAASTQFFNIQGAGNTAPSGTTLNLDVNNGPYTITAWAKPTSCPSARMTVIGKYDGAGSAGTRQWALQTKSGGGAWGMSNDPNLTNFTTGSTANEYVADAAGSCVVNSTVFMAGSYFNTTTPDTGAAAGHAAKLRFQINNGAPVTSNYGNIAVGQNGTSAIPYIGKMQGTAPRYMDGTLDEITVSKVQRDTNWVEVSYETQKKNPTAVTIGASSTPGGLYSAWSGSKEITLNTSASGAKVNANVLNFPVLVRLGATESAIIAAANNGNSIRFSKANGTTELKYQIDSWSSTAAAIWVKLDTVYGNNSTQKIIMYYGNSAAASESNAALVFDSTQYAAVWHMGDTGPQLDATGRAANTATVSGTAPTALASSLIGAGKTFDGASMSYQVGTNASALNLDTDVGPYTLSAWAKPASCEARIAAISKYSNSNDIAGRQYALHTGNTSTSWRFTNGAPSLTAAGVEFFADAVETCVPGNWAHVVGTYRSTGAPTADSSVNAKIYVNGVLAAMGTTASITGTSLGQASNTYIGRIATDERFMNGDLDEIRVAKVARDSNWIRLEHENQKFMNTLVNIGLPVLAAPSAPQSVTGAAGAKGSASVIVSWQAPASNGNSVITGYKATVVGDTLKSCTTTGLSCTVTGLTASTAYTFQVKATNAIGTSAYSAPSASVTSPAPIAPNGSLLISVGHFARPYTFVLPAAAMAVTEELTMVISDVWGRQVWSKTISPADSKVGELTWNGMSSNGRKAGTGIYIVRIKAVGEGKAKEAAQMGVKLRN